MGKVLAFMKRGTPFIDVLSANVFNSSMLTVKKSKIFDVTNLSTALKSAFEQRDVTSFLCQVQFNF